MKTGVELIADERTRQIAKEGWTAEHDDSHASGELAMAGACYAAGPLHTHLPRMLNSARGTEDAGYVYDYSEARQGQILWPWEPAWWKPSGDRVRDLAKAGALIAAEIDRLQRVPS